MSIFRDLSREFVHDSPAVTPQEDTGDGGITVDEELEHLGIGKYHYVAGVICGIANAADAVELLAIGYIIPQLKNISSEMQGAAVGCTGPVARKKVVLTLFRRLAALCRFFHVAGVVSAAIFAGMLIGGCATGFLSDKYGRLPCLLVSLAVNCVFGAVSAFTSGERLLS